MKRENHLSTRNVKSWILVVCVLFLFCVGAGTKQKERLKLTKVYTHPYVPSENQWFQPKLDPTGRYLALVEEVKGEVEITDWQAQKKLSRRTFTEFPCSEKKHPEVGTEWRFVPDSKLAVFSRCDEIYVINFDRLEVVQKLTDSLEERATIADLSANGRYLALRLAAADSGPDSVVLFERDEGEWQRVTRWQLPEGTDQIRFRPDRDELVAAYLWRGECGVLIFHPGSPERVDRYAFPKVLSLPRAPGVKLCAPLQHFAFLTRSPDLVVDGISYTVAVQELLTGEVVQEVTLERKGPIRELHFSPDGELAVSETCDDPQDMAKEGRLTCRLFTIWDVRNGKILYESPNGLAAWTRWARPDFSPDGKYLVVLLHNRVEIFELAREQQ